MSQKPIILKGFLGMFEALWSPDFKSRSTTRIEAGGWFCDRAYHSGESRDSPEENPRFWYWRFGAIGLGFSRER